MANSLPVLQQIQNIWPFAPAWCLLCPCLEELAHGSEPSGGTELSSTRGGSCSERNAVEVPAVRHVARRAIGGHRGNKLALKT